jgi:hypothetical protein
MISTFNLGVAITAISIIVSLASFSLDTKFNLRFKLRSIPLTIAISLFLASIVATFLAEFSQTFNPFILDIAGALFILLAIVIYTLVIFLPVKTINKGNIKPFVRTLNKFLVLRNQNELMKHLEDIVYFYDSLLEFSLESEDAQMIFNQYLSSDLLLTLFSEHGFLFERTIEFFIEQKGKKPAKNLHHIRQFINNLFIKSLNNQNSYLNNFLNEEIYPNSSYLLDELFIEKKNIDYSELFFSDTQFNRLGIDGEISYLKMVGHYFSLIHKTNFSRTNKDGYEKKVDYNDELIKIFFRDIKGFFEREYNQDNLKRLFNALNAMAWDYRWGVGTSDKSEDLRKEAGIFLYDVLHATVSKYKPENEDTFRLNLLDLTDKYLEGQENHSAGNIAYKTFIEKLKEKIIGDGKHGDFGANYKGYFPPLIKAYFYIFGHQLFASTVNDYEKEHLDVPILLKLKESFPRLYMGFKQEFYDVVSLPKEKEEKLQKEGRETIDSFFPDGINYEFSDNSLTYYYSGKNHGSKILLNNIKDKNSIVTKEI